MAGLPRIRSGVSLIARRRNWGEENLSLLIFGSGETAVGRRLLLFGGLFGRSFFRGGFGCFGFHGFFSHNFDLSLQFNLVRHVSFSAAVLIMRPVGGVVNARCEIILARWRRTGIFYLLIMLVLWWKQSMLTSPVR